MALETSPVPRPECAEASDAGTADVGGKALSALDNLTVAARRFDPDGDILEVSASYPTDFICLESGEFTGVSG